MPGTCTRIFPLSGVSYFLQGRKGSLGEGSHPVPTLAHETR
ncbi:hypothetical protein M2280_004496 [Prescottella agglutinans]|uniref:Uncharacterized protein n=1 Tax=Prescottella agglutinans TaxID=1644129 RepID=A0ABT6MG34_9NOCA|nr:hypothetical protein [Prescottella agglutinans]